MIRFLSVALPAAVTAAPAFAHEDGGVVHFLTQPDHVAGLIAVVAVPALFWLVVRRTRASAQRRRIRKAPRKE